MVDTINSEFNVITYDFSNLFKTSKKPDNVSGDYTIYGLKFNFTFADFSFLEQGVDYFRPYIRGFIALLIVFYNINQALNTFGLSYGDRGGKGNEIDNSITERRKV